MYYTNKYRVGCTRGTLRPWPSITNQARHLLTSKFFKKIAGTFCNDDYDMEKGVNQYKIPSEVHTF